MPRNFGIVEQKTNEAAYFLEKLKQTDNPFNEGQYLVSAFLSATRSITFYLQASLKGLDEFNDWYKVIQNKLRVNKLAKYFKEARDKSIHGGYYPIESYIKNTKQDEYGKYLMFFHKLFNVYDIEVPEQDVFSACENYFKIILEILIDCYKTFGPWIDTTIRYTLDGMQKAGITIEDIEVENGFPKGWTNVGTLEERLKVFYDNNFHFGIDAVTQKYLGTDRFGNELRKSK